MTATATTTPVAPAGTWQLDTVHSSASFAVKHMVVSTFRSRFEDFDATLTANEDGTLSLNGAVRADSVAIKDPQLAGHVHAEDFFDVANHPEITFSSTLIRVGDGELIVDGELTIKGKTLPLQARGTITEPVVTLGDYVKTGISLEATVDRTAYDMNWNAPLPKGGFALANDVTLAVELEFVQA
jgi:polyisoprenoid-binding protein YceI